MSSVDPPAEQLLSLPDGRALAYEHNGNFTSKTVVIFFHGAMNVGTAERLPPGLQDKDVHYITPTLPGWGSSSPRPSKSSFHEVIQQDTTLLLNHLYPQGLKDPHLRLYIGGGSFGTVPTQILLGASLEAFPWGQKVAGYLLTSGFPAMYKYPKYGSHMSLANYFAISSFAANTPFKIIPRLISFGIWMKAGTPEKAQKFIKSFLFDKLDEEEKEAIAKAQGRPIEEIRESMGRLVYRSISKSWQGFMDIPVACNENWGLREDVFKVIPGSDEPLDPSLPYVLVTGSKGDNLAPFAFSEWCARNYRNAELFVTPGGHIGGLVKMKEIWEKLLTHH